MVSPTQSSLIASSLLPAQLGTQVSYAVLGKTLDAQRQEGADLVSLVTDATGGNSQGVQPGDPLVAKATGLGSLLDTFG